MLCDDDSARPQEVPLPGNDGDGRWGAGAAGQLVRAAFLRFDRRLLDRAVAALPSGTGTEAQVERVFCRALGALGRGEAAPVELDEAALKATGAQLAAAAIELRALRALFAIEAGDVAGLALARRAALMARTEGIPTAELLTNLVLIRARRYNRQTHLARRIVEALDPICPPAWRPWLDWERLFSGGTLAPEVGRAIGPASRLAALLAGAQEGDEVEVRAHATWLRGPSLSTPLRREAETLVAALDPRVPLDSAADPQLMAWRCGACSLPPAGLHALASPGDDRPEPAAAYVAVWPDGRSARCLALGVPLLGQSPMAQVRQSQRQHGRVETLLAILALAGPSGLAEPDCFARAYGFGYVPQRHRGVFDVLLHRARGAIDGLALLDRNAGRLSLHAIRPLLIPDPRTSRSMTDRVLRVLAERGRASAKEAAACLGVSLRAVQGVLTALAEHQACVVERDGRSVTYAVEDSIFSETTRRLGRALRDAAPPEELARG